MRADYQVSYFYDEAIRRVTANADNWKNVCRITGRLYRYEFDNILMVYMQRPNATLVADYDTWKDPRVGRYVKRGSKGIAIFPSRTLKPYIRYVFDISDTGGRNSVLTWELDEKRKESYAAYSGWGKDEKKESAESFLKDFTEKRIGVIMDLEFGEKITRLVHLAGTKRYLVDDKTQEITAEEALKRSVMYAVFTRCGFDVSPEKQDFSFITAFSSEEEVYRLGSLVSDISCEVLKSISRELTQMERSIAYGRSNVSRSGGRDVVPEPDIAGGEHIHDESRQVRSEGDGIPQREPQREVSHAGEIRETGGEDAGSGKGSIPDDGGIGEQLSERKPAEESKIHDGNVAVEGAGKDAGRGDRNAGSRTEISLEESRRQQQLNSEINSELEELETLGRTETGSYKQASFSFAPNGDVTIPEKYAYIEPKTELAVPHDYIRQVLLKGSGFSNGERRIYEIFQTVSDPGERAKRIKKEYGQGGAGWPVDGYGLHGYDTYHGKGIRFLWRDEEGEKEGYLNWDGVEREISVLIMTGEYYQPQAEVETETVSEVLWQEALKKYFNEEIQYISVKTLLYDIFTTNLSMENKTEFLASIYGEEREMFAMTDRVDGPYGESHITREQEGITVSFVKADGTRGEHQADYRYCADLIMHMIEKNEYLSEEVFEQFRVNPQSFQADSVFMEIYHEYKERMRLEPNFEPVELPAATASHATFPEALKQVEEMDEDLRTVLEIYLQSCSAVCPYQPFLQMVHESGIPKSDRLSFLNRMINGYMAGEDDRTAYHNNAYGLVEYFSNKNTFTVDYKDKNGERKKVSVTYEQIYSVMEYLIRAGQFTDNARMEAYRKDFAQKPYENLSALEKQFRDRQQIINAKKQGQNFHFEVPKLPSGGQKKRYQWNIDAIRLMKQIEMENRKATSEEQKVLAMYVGWGGIPQAFDEKNESWKKEYEELKSLLSETEYAAARESVTTAFYTSPEIIEAIYQGLSQFGFTKGNILEPSVGTGHFFGAMPQEMSASKLYGVEKDSITGRIAKLLYPKAKIQIDGFEETQFPDNFFDVAVGNIPFGDYKLYDPKYTKHNFRIHDYFFGATRS